MDRGTTSGLIVGGIGLFAGLVTVNKMSYDWTRDEIVARRNKGQSDEDIRGLFGKNPRFSLFITYPGYKLARYVYGI